jgi:hypothetical protein
MNASHSLTRTASGNFGNLADLSRQMTQSKLTPQSQAHQENDSKQQTPPEKSVKEPQWDGFLRPIPKDDAPINMYGMRSLGTGLVPDTWHANALIWENGHFFGHPSDEIKVNFHADRFLALLKTDGSPEDIQKAAQDLSVHISATGHTIFAKTEAFEKLSKLLVSRVHVDFLKGLKFSAALLDAGRSEYSQNLYKLQSALPLDQVKNLAPQHRALAQRSGNPQSAAFIEAVLPRLLAR